MMIDYTNIKKAKITRKRGREGRIEYINYAFSFDTETSSFTIGDEKQCCMYLWGFGYGDKCITGRTWSEFLDLYEEIIRELKLSYTRRIIIYVHNLGYDFQFFRKHFNWAHIFSIKEREPLYAVTQEGVEFRDSYLLSGLSLAKTADTLTKHNVKKMVGDLDYDLVRHPETPITEKEMGYLINDCLVVTAYIEEQIEQYRSVAYIPYTKTGKVRKWCRKYILNHQDKWLYKEKMAELTLDDDSYRMCKEAYTGGFSHANPMHVGQVLNNVESFDFTSSYPAVMCSECFPMSAPEHITIKNTKEYCELARKFNIICNVSFLNIRSKINFEHYISSSKCLQILLPCQEDNGRLVRAQGINITITEIDFQIISKCYEWEDIRFNEAIIFQSDPLPRAFLECVYHFYVGKTKLKNVYGQEEEYQNLKEMLNSLYGMCVTDILKDEWVYDTEDNEWNGSRPSADTIDDYNEKKNRFLYYAWGIYITAYARRNLWSGILELKDDYIYSDTDSLKVLNYEKHKDYFDKYNKRIVEKLEWVLSVTKAKGDYKPKTVDGKEKILGVWDREHSIKKFKTLGAKRYLCYYGDKNYMLTVAGLSKSFGSQYLLNTYKTVPKIFEAFQDNLYIPPEYTNKKTHTYLDNEMVGKVTDYLGNTYIYHELSGIHLSNASFNLTLSEMFRRYLLDIEDIRE